MSIKKYSKKFILVLVLIVLFSFCYPKSVKAKSSLVQDITAAPAKIFWLLEEGILTGLNNLFTEDSKNAVNNSTMDADGNITRQLHVYLTPETIIKGKFLLLDANIFKNIDEAAEDENYYYDDDTTMANSSRTEGDSTADDTSKTSDSSNEKTEGLEQTSRNNIVSGKKALRDSISGWYVVLRNFSIVMMLSVLVYVGIRMVLSSIAQDKAKYKAMLKDWLVALCLLIAMHFIMIGILNISSEITKALGGGQNTDIIGKTTDIIQGVLNDAEEESYTYKKSTKNENESTDEDELLSEESSNEDSEEDSQEDTEVYTLSDAYAQIIVLAAIIYYTILFAIKYLKREFTIIFLVLLGPISCLTYPIDKIGDGKSQAFNRWFAEFLYQVIIQPFHLLIYIVLIGTASNLANTNVLYALVCFVVMSQAEKFVREMFGFKDRLGSPVADMMKAGMARDLVSKATSRLMSGKSGGQGPREKELEQGSNGENRNSLNIQRNNPDYSLLGDGDGTESEAENSPHLPVRTENNSTESQDPRQAMLDAYDENFGSPDYDPQERETMANELPSDNRLSFTAEELREQGLDDETINEIMKNTPNMAGDAAGLATLEESQNANESAIGEMPADSAQQQEEEQRSIRDMIRNSIDRFDNSDFGRLHNLRMAQKYGTASRGKRWLKRGARSGKALLKGAAKVAKVGAIAGLAATGATIAAVSGNGAEAAGILAGATALGIRSGVRTIKGVAKSGVKFAKGSYKYYHNSDKRSFANFESNPEQISRAAESFRLNNGYEANKEELQQELRDRFDLSQIKGMNDDAISKAVGRYQELKDMPGISGDKAATQAAIEAGLADKYKGKFGKIKEVQDMINAETKKFEKEGLDSAIAKQTAIRMLDGAAAMNNETLVLPEGEEVIKMPIKVPNVSAQLGIESSAMSKVQAERVNNLTIELMEMNYTPKEIRNIAQNSSNSGGSTAEVIEKYQANVSFIKSQQAPARSRVAGSQGIKNSQVKSSDIKLEVGKSLELRDKHNVPENKIDKARRLEQPFENKKVTKTKTQNELAWELTKEVKGKDKKEIENITERIAGELFNGGSSKETARKDAENAVKQAQQLEKLTK